MTLGHIRFNLPNKKPSPLRGRWRRRRRMRCFCGRSKPLPYLSPLRGPLLPREKALKLLFLQGFRGFKELIQSARDHTVIQLSDLIGALAVVSFKLLVGG